jgi:hypothetical protein
MRRGAKPAKAKIEADLAVLRKSLEDEASRGRQLEERLTEALEREAEALEQQTATAEILRVISRSPTDVQPVFDVMVRNAVRLCDALFSTVAEVDGDMIRLRASQGFTEEQVAKLSPGFAPESPSGTAIRERRVIHIPDADTSAFRRFLVGRGYQSCLACLCFGREKPSPPSPWVGRNVDRSPTSRSLSFRPLPTRR